MKPHRTVKVTAKMLLAIGCCAPGVLLAKKLLPATVSTDPEKNVELAIGLTTVRAGSCSCESCRSRRLNPAEQGGFQSVATKVLSYQDNLDWCVAVRASMDDGLDVGLIAQGLAMVADTLLTAKGC